MSGGGKTRIREHGGRMRCERCKGRGRANVHIQGRQVAMATEDPCVACGGTGWRK